MTGYLVIEDVQLGRMCNRLGLFAHVMAAAMENGRGVINLSFWPYARHFGNLRGGAVVRASGFTPPLPANRIGLSLTRGMFGALKNAGFVWSEEGQLHEGELTPDSEIDLETLLSSPAITRRRVVSLRGWRFRAFSAVARHHERLRSLLEFAPHISSEADRLIAIERRTGLPILGVHIRQTDYKSHLGGKNFFEIDQYYDLARSVIAEHGPHKLLVFSDGPVAKKTGFEGETTIAEELSPTAQRDLVELSMMALCDRLIGPHSSFNQWASFIGQTPLQTVERDDHGLRLSAPRVALPLDFGHRRLNCDK